MEKPSRYGRHVAAIATILILLSPPVLASQKSAPVMINGYVHKHDICTVHSQNPHDTDSTAPQTGSPDLTLNCPPGVAYEVQNSQGPNSIFNNTGDRSGEPQSGPTITNTDTHGTPAAATTGVPGVSTPLSSVYGMGTGSDQQYRLPKGGAEREDLTEKSPSLTVEPQMNTQKLITVTW